MLNLSHELGEGVTAIFTDVGVDFILPESGDVFGPSQKNALGAMGIDVDRMMNIRQVHGGDVLAVSETGRCSLSEALRAADGMITNMPGLVLAVRTADCVPVFLYDSVHRCVGMIHAGWKSTQQRIVCRAVDMMQDIFGADARDIRAALGPSIHSCCYQVGQELCDVFPDDVIPRRGEWFLDLQAANRRQLVARGVGDEHIFDCGICTCCSENYFSYRRQGKAAGRHLSVIVMKEDRS